MTDTYKKHSRKSRAYKRDHARYLADRETKLAQSRRNRQDYSSPRKGASYGAMPATPASAGKEVKP
jgi:hypothetical protein